MHNTNRSDWHSIDWANHRSSLVRERKGKIKGELIWVGVMPDKLNRDEMAQAHRRNGKHVTTGERVIRFDSVSITTYTITIRNKVAA